MKKKCITAIILLTTGVFLSYLIIRTTLLFPINYQIKKIFSYSGLDLNILLYAPDLWFKYKVNYEGRKKLVLPVIDKLNSTLSFFVLMQDNAILLMLPEAFAPLPQNENEQYYSRAIYHGKKSKMSYWNHPVTIEKSNYDNCQVNSSNGILAIKIQLNFESDNFLKINLNIKNKTNQYQRLYNPIFYSSFFYDTLMLKKNNKYIFLDRFSPEISEAPLGVIFSKEGKSKFEKVMPANNRYYISEKPYYFQVSKSNYAGPIIAQSGLTGDFIEFGWQQKPISSVSFYRGKCIHANPLFPENLPPGKELQYKGYILIKKHTINE